MSKANDMITDGAIIQFDVGLIHYHSHNANAVLWLRSAQQESWSHSMVLWNFNALFDVERLEQFRVPFIGQNVDAEAEDDE